MEVLDVLFSRVFSIFNPQKWKTMCKNIPYICTHIPKKNEFKRTKKLGGLKNYYGIE